MAPSSPPEATVSPSGEKVMPEGAWVSIDGGPGRNTLLLDGSNMQCDLSTLADPKAVKDLLVGAETYDRL